MIKIAGLNLTLATFELLILLAVLSSSEGKIKDDPLTDKVQQLTDMMTKRSVVRLNGNKFRELVRNSPRNYSIVVMFTALLAQRQCSICQQAHDEFQTVANSWRYSSQFSTKLFFAMVDFDDGPDAFQVMQLNSAPVFMHFPAKGKPKKVDTMDLQRVGFGADAIAKWIFERTSIQIKVFPPPNYTGTVSLLMIILVVGTILFVRRNNLEFLCNKNLWGVLALFFVFAMISGQMWNHIRSPPLLQRTQNGMVSYIYKSSQGQYVLETYLVMIMYAALVLGMIMLIEGADGKGDSSKRIILSFVGLVLFTLFFSLILSVFRSKAGGYPYSFIIS